MCFIWFISFNIMPIKWPISIITCLALLLYTGGCMCSGYIHIFLETNSQRWKCQIPAFHTNTFTTLLFYCVFRSSITRDYILCALWRVVIWLYCSCPHVRFCCDDIQGVLSIMDEPRNDLEYPTCHKPLAGCSVSHGDITNVCFLWTWWHRQMG